VGFFKRLFGLSSDPAIRAAETGSVSVEMPPPPSGFTWHLFKPARMTVLRPEAWYVHEVGNNESFAGCVSKECIQTEGGFTTGLTLNVIRNFKDRLKQRNSDYHPDLPVGAVVESLYPNLLADRRFQVLYLDQCVQRTPGSRLVRFRYRQVGPVRPDFPWRGPIICQKFIIEFDQSPDVYHFTFEGPESGWDENWTIGKQILTNLVFSATPSTSLIFSVDPPLGSDELLQAKALEVGRALGWSLAHDSRTEGLFIWRIDLEVRREDGSRSNHAGTFAWCMKRVGNEIQLYDPVDLFPLSGISEDGLGAINAAAKLLQEEFKLRWLALVGLVTLREASPEMIDLSVKAAIQVADAQFGLSEGS
jgi:hypothetical protein